MTETSMFWDGTTVGDATTAPYSAVEIATALNNLLGSFVIPYTNGGGYTFGTELFVQTSTVVGKVDVCPGAAMVKGILYTSDALENVSVASNSSGNPRIDYIILQRNTTTQVVRLAVKQGTPGATPSAPAIDLNNEFILGWVWVHDGYDAGADILGSNEIHDNRIFMQTGPSQETFSNKNLLPNAEFIGFSSGAVAHRIAKWVVIGTPTISLNTSTYRGYRLVVTTGAANQGIDTTVTCNNLSLDSPVFTLYGAYYAATAGIMSIEVYSVNFSTGASSLITNKYFRPTGNITDFYMRWVQPDNGDGIRIFLKSASAGAGGYNVAELSLCQGYSPTTVYNHEIIWLDYPMTDAAWTASAKSTGVTTISLVSSFGSVFPPHMRGVILRARCRDSASAAAITGLGTSLTFHHKNATTYNEDTACGIVACSGRANDTWEEQVVYVPLDHTDANASFKVQANASGAGTLDATLEVLGIIT